MKKILIVDDVRSWCEYHKHMLKELFVDAEYFIAGSAKEAYDLFNKMMYEIQSDTVKHLFRTRFGVQIVPHQSSAPEESDYEVIDESEAE